MSDLKLYIMNGSTINTQNNITINNTVLNQEVLNKLEPKQLGQIVLHCCCANR